MWGSVHDNSGRRTGVSRVSVRGCGAVSMTNQVEGQALALSVYVGVGQCPW